ncbi:MAG: galactose-1-phosphate uridylyltransferase [Desulforhopalus sp.]
MMVQPLTFAQELVKARFIAPEGSDVELTIELRTNPITLRTSRVTLSRIGEKEKGTETLPPPPPDADHRAECPFCHPQVMTKTPQCIAELLPSGRLVRGTSLLFPNLFPYGRYSGVSLFDDTHFVEIGTASVDSYRDSLLNSADYLRRIKDFDPRAVYMAITQNHLPSAGGSLLHPHLQVHADRVPSNHHRFLQRRAREYHAGTGSAIFSDYARHEREDGRRYIGNTGRWHWMAAFAPEGFYEIWGILAGYTSFQNLEEEDWENLALGITRIQKFYRSLCRNGYNLGLLFIEDGNDYMEIRIVILVRSNFVPWVRNDHTGYEIMLGDMATFVQPEITARLARKFWH